MSMFPLHSRSFSYVRSESSQKSQKALLLLPRKKGGLLIMYILGAVIIVSIYCRKLHILASQDRRFNSKKSNDEQKKENALSSDIDDYKFGLDLIHSTRPAQAPKSVIIHPQLQSVPNLTFFIIGDWGNPLDRFQQSVSDGMTQMCQDPTTARGCDFIVSVGDNFYKDALGKDGVTSIHDSKWMTAWQNVYKNLTQIPWFSVLGNHDWFGNPQAQLQKSKLDAENIWNMKGFFWTATMQLDVTTANLNRRRRQLNGRVAFIFIDTNLLYYGYDPTPESSQEKEFETMKENFKRLGWTPSSYQMELQLRQIRDELETHNDADWLFVVGHHPLVTCSVDKDQGHMSFLYELLKQYKPTGYLFGHRHALQFADVEGTFYIQSGAGGFQDDVCENSIGWGKGNVSGFVKASLKPTEFLVEYITTLPKSSTVYSTKKRPRAYSQ